MGDQQTAAPERRVQQDIDVALVMNGGVSLAVWIGGVTAEVYRAATGDGLYADLLGALGARVRVDVVTGASAGGLNGAFLAAAMSRGLPASTFDDLRDVWLTAGSIDELLRDPLAADPPSVLRGDEFFRAQIEQVLLGWFASAPPVPLDPFDLVLTATTLEAVPVRYTDHLGTELVEPRTRARFHFTGDHLALVLAGQSGAEADLHLARQLALAARTSASFPGAFEPSFVNVGANHPGRVDMTGIVSFDRPMWAIDGGVLVNKPVRPALDLLARRPAGAQARRLLLYVNPDPGAGPHPEPAQLGEMPSMATVVRRALVDLPQMESISADLDEVRSHNADVEGQRRLRESLLLGVPTYDDDGNRGSVDVDLVAVATQLYPVWLVRDGFDTVARRLSRRFARSGGDLYGPVGSADGTVEARFSWSSLSRALTAARGRSGFLAATLPTADVAITGRGGSWRWGTLPLEYGCDAVLDMLERGIQVAAEAQAERDLAAEVDAVAAAAERVTRIRADVDALSCASEDWWDDLLDRAPSYFDVEGVLHIPTPDAGYRWPDELARVAYERWPAPPPGATGPVRTAADAARRRVWDRARVVLLQTVDALQPDWTRSGVQEALAVLAGRLVDTVRDAQPHLRTIAGSPRRSGTFVPEAATAGAERLGRLVETLDPGPPRDPEDHAVDEGANAMLQRLVALYVVHAMSEPPAAASRIDLVLVSAATPSPLDPSRVEPSDKVNGLQLGHFGAFLKESWRANDWMWGRLDGTARLVAALLDSRRVGQLYRTVDAAMARLDPLLPRGVTPARREAMVAAMRTELSYLEDDTVVRPTRLVAVEEAIVTAFQERIVAAELPVVAAAVTRSGEAGGEVSAAAKRFVQHLPATIQPEQTAALLRSCPIGRETVASERHSDLLAKTATTTAAVAASALQGEHSGLGVARPLLGTIRTVLLTAYLFVTNAVRRTGVAMALTTLLLAAGGSVLLARILGAKVPAFLLVIAITLVVTWVLLLTLTVGAWRALIPVGAGFLVVALSAIDRTQAVEILDPRSGHTWKTGLMWGVGVAAVVIGAIATVFYVARWRRVRHRPIPAAVTARAARLRTAAAGRPHGDPVAAELRAAADRLERDAHRVAHRAGQAMVLALPVSLAFGAVVIGAVWLFLRHWYLHWAVSWFDWAFRWRPLVVVVTMTLVAVAMSVMRAIARGLVRRPV